MITSVISRRARSSPLLVSISLAHLVQLLVDLPSSFARQAGPALEFLAAGGQQPLRRAEMLQQGALAGGSDPAQLVDHRTGHRPVAPAAVVFDREAVRLVADPLQELVALRAARQLDRF